MRIGPWAAEGRTDGQKAKLQFFKRPMHRELLLHCSYITARRRTPVKRTKYNVNAGMKYGSATAEAATTEMQLVLAPILSRPPKRHLPAALQGRRHVGQQRVRKRKMKKKRRRGRGSEGGGGRTYMVRTPSSLLPNAAALFPKGGARGDGRTVGGPPLNCRGSSLFGSRYMVMRHRLVKSECHSHRSRGKAKLAVQRQGFSDTSYKGSSFMELSRHLSTEIYGSFYPTWREICLNSQAAC